MANYEATRYDFDGANLVDIQGLNTGLIIPWTDTSVPSGFLECNGSDVSRTTYSALFAVVGTTYGSGNGSTTFTLPDLSDDVVVGKSPTKALASTGGANTVTTSGNVAGSVGNTSVSTPQIGSHSHNHAGQPTPNATINNGANPRNPTGLGTSPMTMNNTGGGGAHTHPSSINFTGTANSVLQPYLTLLYIIKT